MASSIDCCTGYGRYLDVEISEFSRNAVFVVTIDSPDGRAVEEFDDLDDAIFAYNN
jgi:hypothetical protein